MAWTTEQHEAVVKTLAVVVEVTGTELSAAAAEMYVKQLGNYPAKSVLMALERCAIDCRHRLTLADIVQRLVDGRPGAEEAWALMPKREEDAGAVTDEMSAAWGTAASLYASDQVACRMAFREAYTREVQAARLEAKPVTWRVSPGFDKAATEGAAIEALRKGLIGEREALQYVPFERHARALESAGLPVPEHLLPASNAELKQLTGKVLRHWTDEPPEAP